MPVAMRMLLLPLSASLLISLRSFPVHKFSLPEHLLSSSEAVRSIIPVDSYKCHSAVVCLPDIVRVLLLSALASDPDDKQLFFLPQPHALHNGSAEKH